MQIVTLGQYLRPTAAHLPVARWWAPAEFEELADKARAMGIVLCRGVAAHPIQLSRQACGRLDCSGRPEHAGSS